MPFGTVQAADNEEPFVVKQGQSAPACKSRFFLNNYYCKVHGTHHFKPNTDNPETLSGAPCSIQVFTQRMRDEECMEAAREVDRCLRQAARN